MSITRTMTRNLLQTKRDGRFKDSEKLISLGRQWGLSLILPPEEPHLEAIRNGPVALAEAADYYAIAEDSEKSFVVIEFHEGVRQHYNTGTVQISEMFRGLEKQRR